MLSPKAEDSLAGLTILVVEDEPLLRKHLTAQLERFGADATGAANLSAARQLIAELSILTQALLPVRVAQGVVSRAQILLAIAHPLGDIMLDMETDAPSAPICMRWGFTTSDKSGSFGSPKRPGLRALHPQRHTPGSSRVTLPSITSL